MQYVLSLMLLFISFSSIKAQSSAQHFCLPVFSSDPNIVNQQIDLESSYQSSLSAGSAFAIVTDYTLPVVVHIIHNNGPENISDETVLLGIDYLNQALANTGYYKEDIGVITPFQLCLAQRDPDNNPTNGITRTESSLTDMTIETEDLQLKNLSRWDPNKYINIWLVNEISSTSAGSGVAGYAYFPSAHGSDIDGIVGESQFFGSSPGYTSVFIHELGHYLGLYHTFEGACYNEDCLADGDRVCDTPPDQSIVSVPCDNNTNTCNTDVNSLDNNNPFTSDQNDQTWNYMDYGDITCFAGFSQGQSNRMDFFLAEARSSLVDSYGCIAPCTNPITASFNSSAIVVNAGTSIDFMNSSINATNYQWSINGTLFSNDENASYLFNAAGSFTINLLATNGGTCYSDSYQVEITVSCPVQASATVDVVEIEVNESISFTNDSQNANSYQWYISGVLENTNPSWQKTFEEPGYFEIMLIASNGICSDTSILFIRVFPECTLTDIPSYIEYNPSDNNRIESIKETSNGDYFAISKTEFVKLGLDLSLEWGKRYYISGGFHFRSFDTSPDNSVVVACNTHSQGLVIKLSPTGETEWVTAIDTVSRLRAVKFLNDGDVIVVGTYDNGSSVAKELCLAKISNQNGELLWVKKIKSNTTNGGILTGITGTNLHVLEEGYLVSGSNWSETALAVLMIDETGNIVWAKNFNHGSSLSENHTILLTEQGNIILTGTGNAPNQNTMSAIMELDMDGNHIKTKLFKYEAQVSSNQISSIQRTSDGNYLFTYKFHHFVVKIDPDFNVLWVRNYENGEITKGYSEISPTNGGDYLLSLYSQPRAIRRMSETDTIGGCGYLLDSISSFDMTAMVSDLDYEVINSTNDIEAASVNSSNVSWTENVLCTNPIVGGMDAEVKLIKATECGDQIQLQLKLCNNGTSPLNENVPIAFYNLDPTSQLNASLIGLATVDNNILSGQCQTVELSIPNSGVTNVYCIVNDDGSLDPAFNLNEDFPITDFDECEFYDNIDSIIVTEYNSTSLNLGLDLDLCPGENIVLSAGSGLDFEWQDGSKDSTFVVNSPGLYHVQRIDYCGNESYDEILVSEYATVDFDLGEDVVQCENAVYLIDAGNDYASYSWQDNSIASSYTAWGAGSYWVDVVDHCGMEQSDTIHIFTDPATNIDLGVDTALCPEEVLILDVPGFANYQWTPTNGINCDTCAAVILNPQVATTYSLVANNGQGCVSSDTIFIDIEPLEDCTSAGENIVAEYFLFDIYPNPNDGLFNILFNNKVEGEKELRVYDSLGKLIHQERIIGQANHHFIDLNSAPAGIYLLEVTIEERLFYKWVIVMN